MRTVPVPDRVRLVRVTQGLARRDPSLKELYDEETMKARGRSPEQAVRGAHAGPARDVRHWRERPERLLSLRPPSGGILAPSSEKGPPPAARPEAESPARLSTRREARGPSPLPGAGSGGRSGGAASWCTASSSSRPVPDRVTMAAALEAAGTRAAREARRIRGRPGGDCPSWPHDEGDGARRLLHPAPGRVDLHRTGVLRCDGPSLPYGQGNRRPGGSPSSTSRPAPRSRGPTGNR